MNFKFQVIKRDGRLDDFRPEKIIGAVYSAERAMNRALDGSCHVPVAGLAALQGERLLLQGLVGATADGRCIRAQAEGPAADPQALGVEVAQALLAQGARALIDS